ncbi:LDLR chaperone boca-like isoform X2 [Homalodisca vitripennis]|uniref:LDLR chaperone boca-like isoform X2 n=1 Tax=Homalodisca vitripennis TaxID=197043 RepID=UPI001EECE754|nr:LDLR chaperone boca-like isoform X2 [Homalodisca vitripennis]
MYDFSLVFLFIILGSFVLEATGKKSNPEDKPAWAKKDIRDFSDADMERLLDQWEEDEEPLEPDELPEHLRPQPSLDLSKMNLDSNNPEELLKMTKKGRTLMAFVSILGNPTREESEQLTKLWQGSLWNNHIQAERYMIDDDRAIFMFKDGSMAWDAKDFLIQQDRCKEVLIENKPYYGKNYKPQDESKSKEPAKKSKKESEKKRDEL